MHGVCLCVCTCVNLSVKACGDTRGMVRMCICVIRFFVINVSAVCNRNYIGSIKTSGSVHVPHALCAVVRMLHHFSFLMSHIERFKCHIHDLFTGILKPAVYICQRSTYMSGVTAMEKVLPELGDLTVGMFDMCAELKRGTCRAKQNAVLHLDNIAHLRKYQEIQHFILPRNTLGKGKGTV